jgi:hypothetical protein
VGGKIYTLRFTTNVLAAIEESLKERGPALVNILMQGGAQVLRAVFWAALTTAVKGVPQIPATSDVPVSLEAIGDLIDEAGGIQVVGPTYWLLMVNAGVILRDYAEEAGLIPTLDGKPPKDVAGPAGSIPAPAAPARGPIEAST